MNTTLDGSDPRTPNAAPPGFTPRLAVGTVLGGRFQVFDLLAESRYGELYRGSDGSDDKPVTIKLLDPRLAAAATARARIEQMTHVATQLDHKNIAATYGFFVDGALAFIAVEQVDGSTLREMLHKKLQTGRGFSLKGAYNVIAHVCNALAYAHGTMVHGGLTCDSILVNTAGRVKLTDFGLARALAEHPELRTGEDWAAVAPELEAAPDEADRRADIYSVGVILFQLLTGRPPHHPMELASAVVPEVPSSVDAVIARCIRPSPDERFADAHELKRALHGAVEAHVAASAGAAPVGAASAVESAPVFTGGAAAGGPGSTAPAVAATASPRAPGSAAARPPAPPARSAPPPAPRPSVAASAASPHASAATPPDRPAPARPPAATVAAPARPSSPPPGGRPSRGPSGPLNVNATLAAVDEQQERWLIQKDKLDFGPYRLAEVKHQVEKGQILGDHTIVDMDNGERRRVKDHPLLRELARDIEGKSEEKRQQNQVAEEMKRRHQRTLLVVGGVGGLLLLGGAGVAAWLVTHRTSEVKTVTVYKDRGDEDLLKGIEITMKVDPPAPTGTKKSSHRGGGVAGARGPGQRNANGEFDSATNLGDANAEGGDETLGQDVVQKVMMSNFGVLKGCVLEERRRNGSLKNVEMDFVIRGTGQVSAVKVNGDTKSPFASCMYGKMQAVAFPKFNGAKTHASFSLALK